MSIGEAEVRLRGIGAVLSRQNSEPNKLVYYVARTTGWVSAVKRNGLIELSFFSVCPCGR